MIYCVIPRELEDELLERMTEYYRDNPEVEVIMDRRDGGPTTAAGAPAPPPTTGASTRDRRRPRAAGTFPRIDGPV